MKKLLTLGLATMLWTAQANSANIDINDLISAAQDQAQSQFKMLSEDLSSMLSYKAITPAEPLGILGIDLGIDFSYTELANPEVLENATGGDITLKGMLVPKLHAFKGLPFGLDVGAVYAAIPTTEIKFWGAELRYAILSGGIALPAVAVRLAHTQLNGVPTLDFSSNSLDVSISKGFLMFTPYAGIGMVRSNSKANIDAGPIELKAEEIDQMKTFAGLNLNLGLMNLVYEFDMTGEAQTHSMKFGFRF